MLSVSASDSALLLPVCVCAEGITLHPASLRRLFPVRDGRRLDRTELVLMTALCSFGVCVSSRNCLSYEFCAYFSNGRSTRPRDLHIVVTDEHPCLHQEVMCAQG
jgi:hypothetical protein